MPTTDDKPNELRLAPWRSFTIHDSWQINCTYKPGYWPQFPRPLKMWVKPQTTKTGKP